ncbi:Uncharacterised protein [Bordetella pertussis]|nr:Uncharacterised protein [Bordetella pertussis]CPJ54851.1 Uncharacterised protein [Bordetella pertussis]
MPAALSMMAASRLMIRVPRSRRSAPDHSSAPAPFSMSFAADSSHRPWPAASVSWLRIAPRAWTDSRPGVSLRARLSRLATCSSVVPCDTGRR